MDGFSKDDFKGHSDYVNESMILSLKLVSIPHSCPHMSGHCDVITPPIENTEARRQILSVGDVSQLMVKREVDSESSAW